MEYRIWSNCCGAWWRPNGSGYTSERAEAGLYDEAGADGRCAGDNHRAMCGCGSAMPADMRFPAFDAPSVIEAEYNGEPDLLLSALEAASNSFCEHLTHVVGDRMSQEERFMCSEAGILCAIAEITGEERPPAMPLMVLPTGMPPWQALAIQREAFGYQLVKLLADGLSHDEKTRVHRGAIERAVYDLRGLKRPSVDVPIISDRLSELFPDA